VSFVEFMDNVQTPSQMEGYVRLCSQTIHPHFYRTVSLTVYFMGNPAPSQVCFALMFDAPLLGTVQILAL
jgi:hypothetical protein